MSNRLSWRRQPREKGLARIFQIGKLLGFDLYRGEEHLVSVRPDEPSRWYWYGQGHNTLCRLPTLDKPKTFATPEEAKADAVRWLKTLAARGYGS